MAMTMRCEGDVDVVCFVVPDESQCRNPLCALQVERQIGNCSSDQHAEIRGFYFWQLGEPMPSSTICRIPALHRMFSVRGSGIP